MRETGIKLCIWFLQILFSLALPLSSILPPVCDQAVRVHAIICTTFIFMSNMSACRTSGGTQAPAEMPRRKLCGN